MIYLKDLKEGDICVFFRYCNVRVFPVQLNLFDDFFE